MALDMQCGKNDLYEFFGDEEKSPTNWKKEEILGSGAFGFVYRATKETTEGEMILAVKQIRIVNVTQQQKSEDAITKETTALKQLSHERIIKYYGVCSTKLICHIFIEYMPGGSLNEFIDKKGIIEKDKSRLYSKQILEGIAYLHSVGLFHRDIKSHNVLMLDEDNVKLADFGLTREFEEITQSCTTNVGTIRFMAPEMLKSNKYNKFVDIWSVGCVVLHMATGKYPFYDLKEQQHVVFKLIQDKSPAEDISEPLTECVKRFLQKTFQVDPQKRPTAESLLMDNFITGAVDTYRTETDVNEVNTTDSTEDLRIDRSWCNKKKVLTKSKTDVKSSKERDLIIHFYPQNIFIKLAPHFLLLIKPRPEAMLNLIWLCFSNA